MAESWTTAAGPVTGAEPAIRRIGTGDIRAALAQGIDDFRANPTQLLFLGLLYPIIGLIAARAATGHLLPILFPIFAGLSLMGPLAAVGMYELSRRREAGLPVSWLNAFDVVRSPAVLGIAVLGAMQFVIFGLWLAVARGLYGAIVGPAVPDGIGELLGMVLHTPEGHWLFVIGNLVGFLFAVVVLTISAFSFPMMLDRACSPGLAVQTSVRAVLRNPVTMALWGLVVAALLVAGTLPFCVGLAVVMPVLGHATWHLYRRAVG